LISQINSFNKNSFCSTRKQSQAQKQLYTKPPTQLGYGHSLGVSSILGLSAFGFGTLFFSGWKRPIGTALLTAGISMLFNIPNKIHKNQ